MAKYSMLPYTTQKRQSYNDQHLELREDTSHGRATGILCEYIGGIVWQYNIINRLDSTSSYDDRPKPEETKHF